MSDPYRRVIDILQSDKTGLVDLAELAGCDPATFYRGADLSGVDLRGQDLRSLKLDAANLRGTIIDHKTRFSAEARRKVPMAFDFMSVASDAIRETKAAKIVTELNEYLSHSAGLPRRKAPIVKETSPLTVFAQNVRARLQVCADHFIYDDDKSWELVETKQKVLRTKKILLDIYEVAAFFNHLTGGSVLFTRSEIESYLSHREADFREPVYPNTALGRRRWTQPSHSRLPSNVGLVRVIDDEFFLHLEVLMMGVHFVANKSLSEDQLDALTRAYHGHLRRFFPAELPPQIGRGVAF